MIGAAFDFWIGVGVGAFVAGAICLVIMYFYYRE